MNTDYGTPIETWRQYEGSFVNIYIDAARRPVFRSITAKWAATMAAQTFQIGPRDRLAVSL
jgi:hypothetical protein